MRFKLIVISILMALLSSSCRQEEEEPQQQQTRPQQQTQPQQQVQTQQQANAGVNMRTGVVQEVLQATSYTYLNVKEGDRDIWIAVAKRESEVGETISFSASLEMKDFESKDLQRTFESIYFVDRIVSGESRGAGAGPESMEVPHQMKPVLEKKEISIEPAEGGITIGELLADADSHAGKAVRIKGQVTKVNRAILGKNWVHLQDGTDALGKFDLTITTQEQVNVGDIVTFEGTIALNKDFGAGYVYEVLMEEAKLL